MMDWPAWHRAYDDPDSALARRLGVVRRRIGESLDALGPGPRRVLSLCAGDGRDLLPVLAAHPRRADVGVTLVELDPSLAAAATRAAVAAGLDGVAVHRCDAGLVGRHYGPLPVDLLLLCGIFGNIPPEDILTTIAALPALLAPDGEVIWTRGGFEPDLRPQIRQWLDDAGLAEVAYDGDPEPYGVGVHRRSGAATDQPALPERLFAFVW